MEIKPIVENKTFAHNHDAGFKWIKRGGPLDKNETGLVEFCPYTIFNPLMII